jgi:putative flippase GtrA
MRAVHTFTRRVILDFIDFFYPLFKRIMPLTTYRYAACGGFNTVFSIFLYFIGNNYIFKKHNVNIGFMTLSGEIAPDYLFAIWIAFPVGFYLSRYVVFQESTLHRHIQMFRYFIVVIGNLLLNYLCLKFFVKVIGLYNTPAKIATAVIVIIYSYIAQRNFSFKTESVVQVEE